MGPAGVQLFFNWSYLSVDNKKDPDKGWTAFKQYLVQKSNYRLPRFQLRDMKRGNEAIDSFVTRFRSQVQKCNFTTPTEDDNLIDQLIKGVAHDETDNGQMCRLCTHIRRNCNTATAISSKFYSFRCLTEKVCPDLRETNRSQATQSKGQDMLLLGRGATQTWAMSSTGQAGQQMPQQRTLGKSMPKLQNSYGREQTTHWGNYTPALYQLFPCLLDGKGFLRTIKPFNMKLTAYNGTEIQHLGTLTLQGTSNNSSP